MKCAVCKSVAECKRAFGKYWADKSGGGEGCNHPFSPPPGWIRASQGKIGNNSGTILTNGVIYHRLSAKQINMMDKISKLKGLGL